MQLGLTLYHPSSRNPQFVCLLGHSYRWVGEDVPTAKYCRFGGVGVALLSREACLVLRCFSVPSDSIQLPADMSRVPVVLMDERSAIASPASRLLDHCPRRERGHTLCSIGCAAVWIPPPARESFQFFNCLTVDGIYCLPSDPSFSQILRVSVFSSAFFLPCSDTSQSVSYCVQMPVRVCI